jgi:hypothetical protein
MAAGGPIARTVQRPLAWPTWSTRGRTPELISRPAALRCCERVSWAGIAACRLRLAADLCAPGVEHTEEMARYLWDNQIMAVASDTFAVEVWPPAWGDESVPFGFLHRVLIGQFGMALGELWWLDDLRPTVIETASVSSS